MAANQEMNTDTVSLAASMTGESRGKWLDLRTLAYMARDPSMRTVISEAQQDACAAFSAIVDKTAAILLQGTEPSPGSAPAVPESGPLTARQAARLAIESKQRQQAWQKARELAEMLVIGALLNKDNPDWDPADSATCKNTGQSALLSLLQFEDEGEGEDTDAEEKLEA